MLTKRSIAVSLAALSLVTSLWAWQENTVEVVITLDAGADRPIEAAPDPVELTVGQRLVWSPAGDLEGALMIDFEPGPEGERGPFQQSDEPGNRSRGRYRENARNPIRTLPASVAGEWKYTITWFDGAGNRHILDPVVSVRK